jgi:hypothetical protein
MLLEHLMRRERSYIGLDSEGRLQGRSIEARSFSQGDTPISVIGFVHGLRFRRSLAHRSCKLTSSPGRRRGTAGVRCRNALELD